MKLSAISSQPSAKGRTARRPASWSHTAGRPEALGLPSEAFALRPKAVFGRRVAQAGRRGVLGARLFFMEQHGAPNVGRAGLATFSPCVPRTVINSGGALGDCPFCDGSNG